MIISGGTLYEELIEKTIGSARSPALSGWTKGWSSCIATGSSPAISWEILTVCPRRSWTIIKTRPTSPCVSSIRSRTPPDTEIAVRLAITLGCHEMVILGATGSRVDHLWANIQTLTIPFKAGIDAVILDPMNRIRLIGGETHLKKEDAFGDYFSVFPLEIPVDDFNIRGAKYPLKNHILKPYDSLCVSNEYKEDTVEIEFSFGIVILMETKD